ncbi:DUF4129 domain-containing protein [Solirubrobacter phytolaccae]|uniref:DUF4129 domain-containing protein n=1 Tax=Solirubrobacter phytolaccae TaxID=1404360 RepID=A0A9X3N5F5_9ACTN|nr:DUF4129 domain-containing protein [Solirubrobacter phytolaccae]MDA0180235.1 DUF4129 domain-containing protein [Solirubrobacter phytolaccae]
MTRARIAGVVVLVAACLAPAAAHATEISGSEFRALVTEGDVRELEQVTSVDGQPVDLAAALDGAEGEELEQRLESLAALPPAGTSSVDDPTAQARDILQEERFHGGDAPGPFRGFVDWLGDLAPRDLINRIDDFLPGGRAVVWIALGLVLFVIGFLLAHFFLTRRIALSEAAAQAYAPATDDPKALERRAAEAEAAGDFEAALRLRFRAGLLRLDQRGAIAFRPSISTHEVRHTLHSDDFDELATTFDDVVYGGREPHTEDVAQARERWPQVVSSAREHE